MAAMNRHPRFRTVRRNHRKLGGLADLQRVLGIHQDDIQFADALLVSIDIEGAATFKFGKPPIRQLGIARLDTRAIGFLRFGIRLEDYITVEVLGRKVPQQLGLLAEGQSKTLSGKSEKVCRFAHPQPLSLELIRSALRRNFGNLSEDEDSSKESNEVRNVIIVGHNVQCDLVTLRYLNVDVFDMAPIISVIDTEALARHVLPPPSEASGGAFTLSGVIRQLGHRPCQSEFHNAGNDAVFALFAMLVLAVRDGKAHLAELSDKERACLMKTRQAVERMTDWVMGSGPRIPGEEDTSSSGGGGLGHGLVELVLRSVRAAKPVKNLKRLKERDEIDERDEISWLYY